MFFMIVKYYMYFLMSSIFMTTPLFLGIFMIIIAFFACLYFYTFFSSWMSILIFLIYVSGVLVIFAYFISLEPNQVFKNSKEILFFFIIFFMLPMISIIPFKKTVLTLPMILITQSNFMFFYFVCFLLFVLLLVVLMIFFKSLISLRKMNF